MKKRFFLSFFFIGLCLTNISAQQVSLRLYEELRGKSDNDIIQIVALLDDQANLDDIYESKMHVDDKARATIHRLQEKAEKTHPSLIESLKYGIKAGDVISYEAFWVVNMFMIQAKKEYLERAITNNPDFSFLDLNAELYLDEPTVEQDPIDIEAVGAPESGLRIINAHRMWELGFTGEGSIVMTSDTGADVIHPALNRNWRGNHVPPNEAWIDVSNNPFPIPKDYDLEYSHGTHVTGIMCGLDPATNDTIGVAFDAQWIAAQSTRGPENSISRHTRVLQWAMNPDNNPNTVNDMPDVINNSWYTVGSSCNQLFQILFTNVETAGIAIVFSAGNAGLDGVSSITVPKNINTSLVNTFCVANIQGNVFLNGNLDPINPGSSRGPSICGGEGSLLIKPEVSAPGTRVRSCIQQGQYAFLSGTSMAAPHVSGAIALLKEAFPHLTGEELKLALYYTARDLGEPGEDNTYGMGLIDVFAAYQYLLEQNCEAEIVLRDPLNGEEIFTSGQTIIASSVIQPGSNITMKANNSVMLENGFRAEGNVEFRAYLESCVPGVAHGANRLASETSYPSNLKEDLTAKKIKIYPNPAENSFKINLDSYIKNASLRIINVSGDVIFSQSRITGNEMEIDTKRYPNGIYFVHITSDNGESNVTKLVIQK